MRERIAVGGGTVELEAGRNGGAVGRRTVGREGAGEADKVRDKGAIGAVVVGVKVAIGAGGV